MIVKERSQVISYIKKRQLEKQYLKAKEYLEKGKFDLVNFKIRKPKSERIYAFRITKKYRAIGHFINDIFVVVDISDHQ